MENELFNILLSINTSRAELFLMPISLKVDFKLRRERSLEISSWNMK